MVHEGASVGEIMALQEASISGFFNKIKEFFKKLWAKIKALFHSFIAKFDSMFMKSGKALLKKYRKEIEMKDTSDLEVKFSKKKHDFVLDNSNVSFNVVMSGDVKKQVDDFDNDEEACTNAGKLLNNFKPSSLSDFDKDLHEFFFDDEDELKWGDVRQEVYNVLGDDKLVKNVEKSASTMDAAIAKLIKDLDKAESQYTKDFKDDTHHGNIDTKFSVDLTKKDGASTSDASGNKYSDAAGHQKKQAALTLLSKQASAYQTAINKISAGLVREAKFHGSQCRAALAKAVAYKAKNEAAGLDTIADAVAYDPTILL